MGPWREAMVLVVIFIILGLPDLPFEWFNQFRLEERFGFNKSSVGLWVSDKIKGLTLGFVMMMALIGGLLWLYNFLREALPQSWWLVAFGAFFTVQLVMMVLWPILILPLF